MHNGNVRPGLFPNLFQLFGIKIKTMTEMEKLCVLLVDEMAFKKAISYNPTHDEVEGLEDFDPLGRSRQIASHTLVSR